MKKLEGKTAIVTGASKGIGAQSAISLAAEGAKVIVNYNTDAIGAKTTVDTIIEAGGEAIAVKANMCNTDEVKQLFLKSEEQFDKVDIVVNNAGVYSFESIEAVTEIEYHRQFDNNVLSVLLSTQESLNYFDKVGGGSVINISSVASVLATPHTVVYSATKSAVDSITRTLSKELGSRNIRINSVLPGPTQTEGNPIEGTPKDDYVSANTPLGRIAKVDDISKVVVFLASDDAGWVTGQKICVSGGFD